MKNFNRFLLSILFPVILSACSTMTLDGDVPKTPTSETGTHTKHGSFYNFVWAEPPVEKCERGKGFTRTRHHTNILYSLASIVSLGFYVPQTVEWWCDGSSSDEDEEEYIPE